MVPPMVRRIAPLAACLVLLASTGCHPSKSQLDAIQAQLDEIQAEQRRLDQRLVGMDEVDEGQRRELARLDAAVAGITTHLAELSEAEAAGRQGKFWEMSDLLFDNQELTDENLRKWAKKLRLDVKRFRRDMDDPELRQRILDQQAQGMTLGARGTPAFFVNGRFLSGAQPFVSFQALIDEELAEARRLVDQGVPRDEVYRVTVAEGRTRV